MNGQPDLKGKELRQEQQPVTRDPPFRTSINQTQRVASGVNGSPLSATQLRAGSVSRTPDARTMGR